MWYWCIDVKPVPLVAFGHVVMCVCACACVSPGSIPKITLSSPSPFYAPPPLSPSPSSHHGPSSYFLTKSRSKNSAKNRNRAILSCMCHQREWDRYQEWCMMGKARQLANPIAVMWSGCVDDAALAGVGVPLCHDRQWLVHYSTCPITWTWVTWCCLARLSFFLCLFTCQFKMFSLVIQSYFYSPLLQWQTYSSKFRSDKWHEYINYVGSAVVSLCTDSDVESASLENPCLWNWTV